MPSRGKKRREYNKAYYAANRDKICGRRKAYARQHVARKRCDNIAVYLHQRAKHRATNTGVNFNIEVSDVIVPANCPLLGITLKRGTARTLPSSPSLDRIDPTKGYIKGNIWVLSHKANTMKNNASLGELRAFAAGILKHFGP